MRQRGGKARINGRANFSAGARRDLLINSGCSSRLPPPTRRAPATRFYSERDYGPVSTIKGSAHRDRFGLGQRVVGRRRRASEFSDAKFRPIAAEGAATAGAGEGMREILCYMWLRIQGESPNSRVIGENFHYFYRIRK